ncbi:MAG: peroxide stress protein YaaA [Candidatus Nanopelagicales bacterium]
MLILLPPSEGKTAPKRGRSLDLARLSAGELTPHRAAVLDSLTSLCWEADPTTARRVLGLPPGLADLVALNAGLRGGPTAPAATIYTGVLFAALDLPSLHGAELRAANSRIAIMSGLFGMVTPTDRICAYRLSADVNLPGIGNVASSWRSALDPVFRARIGRGLLIDMRSAAYVKMWPVPADLQRRCLTVKIWQRGSSGAKTAVSHHNKAAKGELARLLATALPAPTTPAKLLALCIANGWDVEVPLDHPNRLDVTVA